MAQCSSEARGTKPKRDDQQEVPQCDVCCGSHEVVGFGPCPQCVETEVVDVEVLTEKSSAINSDAKAPQCELCCGRRHVDDFGNCPKCTADPGLSSGSSSCAHVQVQSDRAMAELLELKEGDEEKIRSLTLELEKTRKEKASAGSGLWHRLATIDEDVSDEAKVCDLFERRQGGHPTLQIVKCIKVENDRLSTFKEKPGNHPTLVFHGTPEKFVANIVVEGLLMEFCAGCGGIYGAKNPQTSHGYSQKQGDERLFMALCVYDLSPDMVSHPAVYVPEDDAAIVLWLLKVEKK